MSYDLPDKDGEACPAPVRPEELICQCRYPRPDGIGECTGCRRLVLGIDPFRAHAAHGIHTLELMLRHPEHPAFAPYHEDTP